MKIKLNNTERLELLKAWKSGILDTDRIKQLKEMVEKYSPARTLTKEEAKELWKSIEEEY